ncbi:glucose-6-phosphate isomerase (macronuclear) [Tetrahymena thermophila SB210]|uniref:Glucose-6-phosphate isomerase n=1 Tax=Tetrahymena thermophila (strain SB210) TaxID=312017 RepID=Q22B87_TETTS|nr:glucose-6-phosphate isomerase [Tetrahymena thermophila SB210]EAR82566.2 glucose-6-phosphate isomerase [Tetrahymena thermophila SB210]|eukprot:XP_001030229.2 glucose-6-phosphate isomerase [Tetrahymena thermophila SB210]
MVQFLNIGFVCKNEDKIKDLVNHHMCAASTNLTDTSKFGISAEKVFGFWDWVSGRYQVWSAVGQTLIQKYVLTILIPIQQKQLQLKEIYLCYQLWLDSTIPQLRIQMPELFFLTAKLSLNLFLMHNNQTWNRMVREQILLDKPLIMNVQSLILVNLVLMVNIVSISFYIKVELFLANLLDSADPSALLFQLENQSNHLMPQLVVKLLKNLRLKKFLRIYKITNISLEIDPPYPYYLLNQILTLLVNYLLFTNIELLLKVSCGILIALISEVQNSVKYLLSRQEPSSKTTKTRTLPISLVQNLTLLLKLYYLSLSNINENQQQCKIYLFIFIFICIKLFQKILIELFNNSYII